MTLLGWAVAGVFLWPGLALALAWLMCGVAQVVAAVRRTLAERERVRREHEQAAFDGEARAARRRRYPAAGGCGGFWR